MLLFIKLLNKIEYMIFYNIQFCFPQREEGFYYELLQTNPNTSGLSTEKKIWFAYLLPQNYAAYFQFQYSSTYKRLNAQVYS